MNNSDLDYAVPMREFYAAMHEYIADNAALQKEYEAKANLTEFLDMDGETQFSTLTDWFIFDYRKKEGALTVLEQFIERGDLTPEKKALYGAFRDQVYSIFEVKALRLGKQLLLYDLLAQKEYQVFDSRASQYLVKGQCAFIRVLPFKSIFILTGSCFPFPLSASAVVRLAVRDGSWTPRGHKGPTRLNLLDVSKILCEVRKPEKLPPEEAFSLFCSEAGVAPKEIEQVIREAKEQSRVKGSFNDIIERFVRKIPIGSKSVQKLKEISEAFLEMWGFWLEEANPYARKGPLETSLIRICMDHMHKKIDPDDYPNKTLAENAMNRLQKEWLLEPKPEFGGKTPTEVILEEREKLGNPQKQVAFSVSLSELEPGADLEKQAEALFRQGSDHLKANEPQNAVNAYRKYLELGPWNHVVWLNLGVAYVLLLDVKNALACYEKALELKPNYKLAKKNLRSLKNVSVGDLKKMADEFRMVVHNEDKRKTIELE